MDFKGKRVTVMGLGSFGGQVGAVRFLADQGAGEIIVTDVKGADELADSLDQIADLPNVRLRLGGHDESDFVGVDAVVVSPAVRKDHPLLAAARSAGVALTSEMNLFFERCPAPIVGVTGSAGKSTTASMIQAVLGSSRERKLAVAPTIRTAPAPTLPPPASASCRNGGEASCAGIVHLGGNIGHHALLPRVGHIAPGDLVVLELSSFQLEALEQLRRSPHVAVVTNVAPNHLDRHGTMAEYVRCKQNILRFQTAEDVAVLNGDEPAGEEVPLADWARLTPGRVVWFQASDAAGLSLRVVGRHNRSNAAAALAVGRAMGVPEEAIAAALAEFRALPHRLELVGEAGGVRFYNDSKSTTPGSTLTALDALADEGTPVVVIVGGYDKGIDLEPLCRELARRARAVVAIGQTRAAFCELIKRHRPPGGEPRAVEPPDGGARVKMARNLPGAVRLAAWFARPGEAVLLSPACASYDMFANYEDRGEQFRACVRQLC